MRLVVTKCYRCKKITGAKHADTIQELEDIGAFIREKKRLFQELSVLDYGHSNESLTWCSCEEDIEQLDSITSSTEDRREVQCSTESRTLSRPMPELHQPF